MVVDRQTMPVSVTKDEQYQKNDHKRPFLVSQFNRKRGYSSKVRLVMHSKKLNPDLCGGVFTSKLSYLEGVLIQCNMVYSNYGKWLPSCIVSPTCDVSAWQGTIKLLGPAHRRAGHRTRISRMHVHEPMLQFLGMVEIPWPINPYNDLSAAFLSRLSSSFPLLQLAP